MGVGIADLIGLFIKDVQLILFQGSNNKIFATVCHNTLAILN